MKGERAPLSNQLLASSRLAKHVGELHQGLILGIELSVVEVVWELQQRRKQ